MGQEELDPPPPTHIFEQVGLSPKLKGVYKNEIFASAGCIAYPGCIQNVVFINTISIASYPLHEH